MPTYDITPSKLQIPTTSKQTTSDQETQEDQTTGRATGSISWRLNQGNEYEFNKEKVESYANWLYIVKEGLKKVDMSLDGMESKETAEKNLNIAAGMAGVKMVTKSAASIGIGAAMGSVVPVPVVGTVVGAIIGLGASLGIDYGIDKIKYHIGSALPYPKTRNLILDINNFDKNYFYKKYLKFKNKKNLFNTISTSAVGKLLSISSPLSVPVSDIVDIGEAQRRYDAGLSNEKIDHLIEILEFINDVTSKAHPEAVNYMLKHYRDEKMQKSGVVSQVLGKKLDINELARWKNKVDIRASSIMAKVNRLRSH